MNKMVKNQGKNLWQGLKPWQKGGINGFLIFQMIFFVFFLIDDLIYNDSAVTSLSIIILDLLGIFIWVLPSSIVFGFPFGAFIAWVYTKLKN